MANDKQTKEQPKNEVATTPTMTIEQVLESPAVQSLGKSLQLTPTQIAKANSQVLKLQCDDKLKYCKTMSKVRFCYQVATFNYKNPNAIAPVPMDGSVQLQMQYQAFIEDMNDCGGVIEVNWCKLYKGQKYETFINKNDCKEIKELPIIKLDDPFQELEVIGYYCYAKCKNGKTYTSLLSIEQVKQWALRYSISYKKFCNKEAKSAIWNDNFDIMAIKTCVKIVGRLVLKDYPNDRLAKALELDQAVFDENGVSYADNPQPQEQPQPQNGNGSTIVNTIEQPKVEKDPPIDVVPIDDEPKGDK